MHSELQVSWMEERETSQVRVEFEGDLQEMVLALKEYYGIKNNADLIRFLVTIQARQLKLEA
jgi:hypothetical protein